jgi:hypothetical protein
MPQVTPHEHHSSHNHQKDPIALLWIIVGLLSAVATFMAILTLVPKY